MPKLKSHSLRFNSSFSSSPAFTIVELLVVIVVIGILAAITIVSYTGITSRATASALQSDLTSASQQLKLYQIDHSTYPTSLNASNCPLDSLGVVDNTYCLKPTSGNTFLYSANNNSNPQTFSLYAINTSTNTKYRTTNDSTPTLATPVNATGGTITTVGGYKIHTFTTSGTFTVTSGDNVEVLVVGGGGGGGSDTSNGGGSGGGGAGGLIYNTVLAITPQTYAITIGGGGAAGVSSAVTGSSGGNSSALGLTAIGGGGGGGAASSIPGGNGGSGGGAGYSALLGGFGTIGQGYNGGGEIYNQGNIRAGGGGGAGGNGYSGGGTGGTYAQGGIGISLSISGTATYYAGGGGGSDDGGTHGAGGLGGGANGSSSATQVNNGGVNTGGGGGGNGVDGGASFGGSGGSGIVIIRYPN